MSSGNDNDEEDEEQVKAYAGSGDAGRYGGAAEVTGPTGGAGGAGSPPGHRRTSATSRASRTTATKKYDRAAGDTLLDATKALAGPLVLTAFSSILHLAFWAHFCENFVATCGDREKYAIAVGSISVILLAGYTVAVFTVMEKLPEKTLLGLSLFLFIWWGVSVFVLTFRNFPISTGFFTTWASFLFSGLMVYVEFEQFRSLIKKMSDLPGNRQSEFFVFLASLIVLIAAAYECGDGNCGTNTVLALVFGSVSVVMSFVMLYFSTETLQQKVRQGFAAFFVILWSVGVGIFTIAGPFTFSGNGLLSCWAAFLASFFVAQENFFPGVEDILGLSYADSTSNNAAAAQKQDQDQDQG